MYSGCIPRATWQRTYVITDVMSLTGRTRMAIYQLLHKKKIPAPILGEWPLTWDADDIDQWIEAGGNIKRKTGRRPKETTNAKSV